ncbi:MAG: AtpZ/AtpI family protein [Eubacteriales bacterium]
MGYKKSVFRTMSLITQLGISILVPIFLCVFVGKFLAGRYDLPVFVPLLILGILSGCRNAYILVIGFVKEADQDNSRDTDRYIKK